ISPPSSLGLTDLPLRGEEVLFHAGFAGVRREFVSRRGAENAEGFGLGVEIFVSRRVRWVSQGGST
ncbi:MAG: hypothetical protein K8R88_15670, partial [Armatimonadetes bacterium]|nr:hypothetical protein [Armatimonadota bacterium]